MFTRTIFPFISFEGGVVLVSHDFRLISQVADQIWLCEEGKVTPWQGSIADYKDHLRKQVAAGTVNGKNK